jgi:hypothetical protein
MRGEDEGLVENNYQKQASISENYSQYPFDLITCAPAGRRVTKEGLVSAERLARSVRTHRGADVA